MSVCQSPNEQLQRTVQTSARGAPQVRHFIVHMRRAGHVVARPLNCGVRRHSVPTRIPYDPHYVARLGAAVYVFAWYEWAVIYLIEQFGERIRRAILPR